MHSGFIFVSNRNILLCVSAGSSVARSTEQHALHSAWYNTPHSSTWQLGAIWSSILNLNKFLTAFPLSVMTRPTCAVLSWKQMKIKILLNYVRTEIWCNVCWLLVGWVMAYFWRLKMRWGLLNFLEYKRSHINLISIYLLCWNGAVENKSKFHILNSEWSVYSVVCTLFIYFTVWITLNRIYLNLWTLNTLCVVVWNK